MENTSLPMVDLFFTEDLSAAVQNHIQKEWGDGDMQRGVLNCIDYVTPEKRREIFSNAYENGVSDTLHELYPQLVSLCLISTVEFAVIVWQNRSWIKEKCKIGYLKTKIEMLKLQLMVSEIFGSQQVIESETNDINILGESAKEGDDIHACLQDA